MEIVNEHTVWRMFLSHVPAGVDTGSPLEGVYPEGMGASSTPPPGWAGNGFDAGGWARSRGEIFGGYGFRQAEAAGLLCLRTHFGVKDAAKVRELRVDVAYRGGAVVYVNGREVARGHMPDGPLTPHTPAEAYPETAYTAPDGKKALPYSDRPATDDLEHYESRIRRLNATVPRDALRDGSNVLAIELHRPANPGFPGGRPDERDANARWNPLGFCGATLAAGDGRGVSPNTGPPDALQVWTADPMQSVSTEGACYSDPLEPPHPIGLVGTRNGVCSGQAIISSPAGLDAVSVNVGPLISDAGYRMPDAALRIRYAVQGDAPYCDTLLAAPPAGARVLPVWLIVEIPKEQEPGRYTGEFRIKCGEQAFDVPVELTVSRWTLPDPVGYITHVSLLHSPDTLALKYGVEPFSDRHFDLIAKSLSLMGSVGNDVIYVPVIRYTHLGNNTGMIRWARKGEGADRYVVDFSVLERFLDLYTKHCGPPKVLCLEVWNRNVRNGRAPLVTGLDSVSGEISEIEAPHYSKERSAAFWRPMMEGVRDIVKRRGWNENCIMLGVAADWWPRPATVEFYKTIAPYARWAIFTHGRRREVKGDRGKDTLMFPSGMEIGYYEHPQGWGRSRFVGRMDYAPWPHDHTKAGSMRYSVLQWSHPVSYRNLSDASVNPGNQGFGRVGLDYWPVKGRTLIGAYQRWGKLYRLNPRSIIAAGDEGPVSTVRFQMLREGVQEAEARIFIADVLRREEAPGLLGRELHARAVDLLKERLAVRVVARKMPEAQISLDGLGLTRRLFDTAADIADALSATGGKGLPPSRNHNDPDIHRDGGRHSHGAAHATTTPRIEAEN